MTSTHMILRYVHIAAGTLTLLTGLAAVSLPKGSLLHRRSGNVFFGSMLVLGIAGIVLSLMRVPNMGNILGGATAVYMVATAWATVIRPAGRTGAFEIIAALIGFLITAGAATLGALALMSANGRFAGYPPLMYFIFAGILALATALDVRMIRRGGLTGAARTTRHLWRMCLAFFMATGSFFFGQPKFVPGIMKETGLFIVAGLLPLALLVYFLARVRLWPVIRRTLASRSTATAP